MIRLYGKGIWILYSAHADVALEMAQEIGATHVLCRIGYRGMFFPEAAFRLCDRARAAGLTVFAWISALSDDPVGEARVARKSVEVGCQGVVLDVGASPAVGKEGATILGQRLLDLGLNPEALFYSAPPAISRHPDVPYAQLNAFCKGGFMPKSAPLYGKPAEVTIHKLTYEEHRKWSAAWGYSPPLYPVLVPYRDECGTRRLAPTEFARWLTALSEHRPTFFSIFHAGATDRDLWPLLAEVRVPRPPRSASVAPLLEPASSTAQEAALDSSAEPARQPVIVTVQVSDTVWSLCEKYGCTRAQFWEWNGYLWDERGWPRDANYLQPGWRVRVG